MTKKIMHYGFEESSEKYSILNNIAEKYGVYLVEVSEKDLNQTIGYLLCKSGFEKDELEYKGEVPGVEFLLFSRIDSKELRSIILDLKVEGVRVGCKAVETETNINWKLGYILEHVSEEHEMVRKFNELGKLVKKAQIALDEREDEELSSAIEFALSSRELVNMTIEDIDIRFKKLEEAMSK